MAVLNSFGIWNLEGGTGKSTIAFHLATRYAERHPRQSVLAIDLCPQANLSMMFLGGGIVGEAAVLDNCTAVPPKTVVGYLNSVITGGCGAPLPNPRPYLLRVHPRNSYLPDNIYLMCGDGNLELMATAIHDAASAPAMTPASQPWKWTRWIFRRFIESVAQQRGARDWTVFVDTTSNLSIYTELAVAAMDRLITPVNSGDSSGVGTNGMLILLHGQVSPHPIYGSSTFAANASQLGVPVPRIHLVVGNRITRYGDSAKAFTAPSDATADTLWTEFLNRPEYFTTRPAVPRTLAQYRKRYCVSLRDFNTAGVVAPHLGRRLSQMQEGYYAVHGERVHLNKHRISECLDSIDDVLDQL